MRDVRGARVVVRVRDLRDAEPSALVDHGGAVAFNLQPGRMFIFTRGQIRMKSKEQYGRTRRKERDAIWLILL